MELSNTQGWRLRSERSLPARSEIFFIVSSLERAERVAELQVRQRIGAMRVDAVTALRALEDGTTIKQNYGVFTHTIFSAIALPICTAPPLSVSLSCVNSTLEKVAP